MHIADNLHSWHSTLMIYCFDYMTPRMFKNDCILFFRKMMFYYVFSDLIFCPRISSIKSPLF